MSDALAVTSERHSEHGEDLPESEELEVTPELLSRLKGHVEEVRQEVRRVFMGSEQVIDGLFVALLARGHVLLEGVPGVAKTTLVRTFAQTINATFRRIQFTPDLLPSDITGVFLPNLRTNEFILRRGPIFANLVLGDEINRAPAKTQSALLEAMQERQVTIEGETHILEEPFLVLATQNPLEQEGVYPLPEAQLDRFLLKIAIGYPNAEQEMRMLKTHQRTPRPARSLLNRRHIQVLRLVTDRVHVSDELLQYIIRLARFTRDNSQVSLGASPRAALGLLKAAQARAVLYGRDFVLPDDIRSLVIHIFSHRILLHAEAELSGVTPRDIVEQGLRTVRYSEGR